MNENGSSVSATSLPAPPVLPAPPLPPPPMPPPSSARSEQPSRQAEQYPPVTPTLASLLSSLKAHHKHHNGKTCCDKNLHLAAFEGDLKKLRHTLKEKDGRQFLNFRNHLGCTPLRLAVSAGNLECVRELLKYGADPDIPDIKAQTPVMMAVKNNHMDCLRCLLEGGADPNGDVNSLYAPVMWAAQEGNLRVIKELLKFGAKVDRHDSVPMNLAKTFPSSPARITLIHNRMDCFKTLLLAGAEQMQNDPEQYRCSLYYVAISNKCDPDIIFLIHEHGLSLWDYSELEAMVVNKSLQNTSSWQTLKSLTSQPYTLMSRCRIVIRKHLLLFKKIAHLAELPLPPRIAAYLEFR